MDGKYGKTKHIVGCQKNRWNIWETKWKIDGTYGKQRGK